MFAPVSIGAEKAAIATPGNGKPPVVTSAIRADVIDLVAR